MDGKDIQVQEKKEVESPGELTQEGPFFVPSVDIIESSDHIVVVADMPGVSKDDVDIRVEEGILRLQGNVSGNTPGVFALSEYSVGNYYRTFALSADIDQSGIKANMKNGVLRIVLPKSDKSKPRKITVKSN